MRIENTTPEIGNFTKASETQYLIDYGVIKKNSNSIMILKLTNTEPIEDLKVSVSCGGCTKATIAKKEDNGGEVHVSYKTSILGGINRKAFIKFREKGKTKETSIVISLKGKVIQ